MNAESRIFFCQFLKSNAHFFLVSFSFRFNRNGDYRIREYHGFQNDRSFLVTESIAGSSIFQTYCCCNVAGINHINLFTVVSMHLQDTADTFSLTFGRVVNIRTGAESTRVHTEESEFTNKRVSHNFESQSGERFAVAGRALVFFTSFRIYTFDMRNISRSRHECYNSIQQRLNAFVLVRRATADRSHFAGNGLFADTSHNFFFSQLFAFQIFHHQFVIAFSNCFHQSLTILVSFFDHIGRNLNEFFFFTKSITINDSFHFDQIDHTFKGIFKTDR